MSASPEMRAALSKAVRVLQDCVDSERREITHVSIAHDSEVVSIETNTIGAPYHRSEYSGHETLVITINLSPP